MEFRNLRSKAFPVSLALALVGLAGCGDPEKLNLAPKPLFEENFAAREPDFGGSTKIGLHNSGNVLKVGTQATIAASFFPKPPKGYEFRDLPGAFGPEFKSHGWESAAEGFGLISFEGKVVSAMRLFHLVDESRVQSELEAIRKQLGPEGKTFSGRNSRYWFWEQDRDRQMICAVKEGKDTFLITIAAGELNAMDALRMNAIMAESDSKRADAAPIDRLSQ